MTAEIAQSPYSLPISAVCRNYRVRTDLIVCTVRLPRARCALAMTVKATLLVIARLAEQAVAIPCRDYQLRTNLFVFSVCRLRGRHAEVVVPYEPWNAPSS